MLSPHLHPAWESTEARRAFVSKGTSTSTTTLGSLHMGYTSSCICSIWLGAKNKTYEYRYMHAWKPRLMAAAPTIGSSAV